MERVRLAAKRALRRIARNAPGQRNLRREIAGKERLRWWLIYGSTRSGTTYISELAKSCASLWIGDWRLGSILAGIEEYREVSALPNHDHIEFDYPRLLRDLSRNIMDTAYPGDGRQLDFVYKQAVLRPKEHRCLVAMWGPPERVIFCLREPSGFIASARIKFPRRSVEHLQQQYVTSLEQYLQIGGDIIEYVPDLSLADYQAFLAPLDFSGVELPEFRYTGEQDDASTSEAMWQAYRKIRALAQEGAAPG